jgi:TP901 family phage tail tape measure protein
VNLRELRYRIYGEDRLSGKLDVISNSANRSNSALNKTTNNLSSLKSKTSAAANEIPLLSRGMRLLSNPAILAAGGVALIGKGLWEATEAAVAFDKTFRELSNLNLDIPRSEVAKLKEDVLNTAAKKGFDANATSRGFYDVQSVTGKGRYETKQIVEKQGEFARLMNADFNQWIEGSGKAMANYGFGADELDRFNKSAYATVKVGSITYEQLSKVQAAYAGSAAAAGQSFESANKLLTLFTIKTKSADEAATLTKSAFIDLFKASTIEAFERAGVSMYDAITGGHRQVDDIMKDLNKRFMEAKNDQEIDALRNQFAGSEGLNALIQTAADKTGNFVKTIQSIDSVDLGLNRAMKEAREDVDYMDTTIKNMMETEKIKLGEDLMFVRRWWNEFKLEQVQHTRSFVNLVKEFFTGVNGFKKQAETEQGDSVKGQYQEKLNRAHLMKPEEFEANQAELVAKYKQTTSVRDQFEGWDDKQKTADYMKSRGLKSESFARDEMKSGYFRWQSAADAYKELIEQFPAFRENPLANPNATDAAPAAGGDGLGTNTDITPDPKVTKGLSDIAGGGQQVKSVTVDFKSLVENLNINTTTLTESGGDIERKITEFIIRAVGGAEQIMSAN